ncbi:MAG: hypothetical protein ACRY3E_03670 [Candidatus Lariskella arthropodorum]
MNDATNIDSIIDVEHAENDAIFNLLSMRNTGTLIAGNNMYLLGEKIYNEGFISAKMICMPNALYSGSGTLEADIIFAQQSVADTLGNKHTNVVIIPEHTENWSKSDCDEFYAKLLPNSEL